MQVTPASSKPNYPALFFDHKSGGYIYSAAKWALLLSILGFVLAAFMIIAAATTGLVMDYLTPGLPELAALANTGWLITLLYLLFGILFFIPFYFLYRFSSKAEKAIINHDEFKLASAFSSLKSHYKFFGIFLLLGIMVYIAGIVMMLVTSM